MTRTVHHLGLVPEVLFQIGPVAITNAHLAFFLISILLIGVGLYAANTSRIVPNRIQSVFEGVIVWFKDKVDLGFNDPVLAQRILPLILTLFFAIFISNQFMLLPFLSVVMDHELIFRLPTTHFSFTLALGLMVVVSSHLIAISISPRRHFAHFIKLELLFKVRSIGDLLNWFLESFLGLLEIIDEVAKVISISARLFGNIFAGELMGIVVVGISVYTSFIVPTPLYVLGIFVGAIQAVVFCLMSVQYLSRLANSTAAAHH
ncbi:MAG: FoF1 ATP synthase subunit a [Patescibacteria group bacterium]|jgi:F-type H+-transporting ATPase subunit a